MQLTPEQLDKFKVAYFKEFGITLSPAETLEKASAVLRFVQLIKRPLSPEQEERVKKLRRDTYLRMIEEGTLHTVLKTEEES